MTSRCHAYVFVHASRCSTGPYILYQWCSTQSRNSHEHKAILRLQLIHLIGATKWNYTRNQCSLPAFSKREVEATTQARTLRASHEWRRTPQRTSATRQFTRSISSSLAIKTFSATNCEMIPRSWRRCGVVTSLRRRLRQRRDPSSEGAQSPRK